MDILLEGIGKRFVREWIFRNVNLEISGNRKYAVTGHNGSGKSTLLQIIGGIQLASEGTISYTDHSGKMILPERISMKAAYAAPYQELPEELTGKEVFDFHFQFREKALPISPSAFFELAGLSTQAYKQVKYYSSGMKQRLKLGLCLFTRADIYLLDEPTSNLDRAGINWYKKMLSETITDKPLIISSNIEEEYEICTEIIRITDFRK